MDSYVKFILTDGLCGYNVLETFVIDGGNKQAKITPSLHLWEEIEWVLARLVSLFPSVREEFQAGKIRIVSI